MIRVKNRELHLAGCQKDCALSALMESNKAQFGSIVARYAKKKNQINALNNYKRITFRIIYLFGKLVLVFRNLPANSKHRLQKQIAISYKKTPEKKDKKSQASTKERMPSNSS